MKEFVTLPAVKTTGRSGSMGGGKSRFVTLEQTSPFLSLMPSLASREPERVWDPIMSRWCKESDVYVAPTPPGQKSVTPWEKTKMSDKYRHYLGIPAYKEPEAKAASPTSTTQTDATTLSGIVKVKWFHAKAAPGKDIYVDWTMGSHQFCLLTENKVIHLSRPYSGLFCLSVWQDALGPWTLTWDINATGKPVVYWPGGEEPVMTATISAHDMYSFAWLPFAAAGAGAYEGMCTQDMRVPATP